MTSFFTGSNIVQNVEQEIDLYTGAPFVHNLTIQNFRCFPHIEVKLAVPNGTAGSGLNLFVGNNGTGKTTVLEAFDYLFGGRYKGENRLKIRDFCDFENPIFVPRQRLMDRLG